MATRMFSVSITEVKGSKKVIKVKNKLKRLLTSSTLGDVLELDFDFERSLYVDCNIEMRKTIDDFNTFKCSDDQTLLEVLEFDDGLKIIEYLLTFKDEEVHAEESVPSRNGLQLLMANARALITPKKKVEKNGSERSVIHNTVIDKFSFKFPSGVDADLEVQPLVSTLWYIDGSIEKIMNRSKNNSEVKSIPEKFHGIQGFKDWRKKKKKAPSLDRNTLRTHSNALWKFCSQPFATKWSFIKDIEDLAASLDSYAEFLQKSNETQLANQSLEHPVRQLKDHVTIQHIPATFCLREQYELLDDALLENDIYMPLFFNPSKHLPHDFIDRKAAFIYFKDIQLSVSIDLLRYDPGSNIGAVSVIWRVPENRDSGQMLTTGARILSEIESELPGFHTRQMRNNFTKKVAKVQGLNIPKHVLRHFYTDLTGDATDDQNPLIDERLRQAFIGEDPDLIVVLRHINKGRPNDTFKTFFDEMEKKVEEIAAADERRHGVEHLSEFISLRDLILQVATKCPEGTPIPSETTVLFAFTPKNSFVNTAKL